MIVHMVSMYGFLSADVTFIMLNLSIFSVVTRMNGEVCLVLFCAAGNFVQWANHGCTTTPRLTEIIDTL